VENVHGTIREEEVDWPECVLLFCVPANFDFYYFIFKSSVFNILHLVRIFKKLNVWKCRKYEYVSVFNAVMYVVHIFVLC
jgi:hypothetical protein